MTAVNENLLIEAGTDFDVYFTLRDENSNYINLSNYAIVAKMSKSYYSSSKISLNIVVTNASIGEIRLRLSSSVTSTLLPGRYVYDIVITAPINQGGQKTRVLKGIITVDPGVSL